MIVMNKPDCFRCILILSLCCGFVLTGFTQEGILAAVQPTMKPSKFKYYKFTSILILCII